VQPVPHQLHLDPAGEKLGSELLAQRGITVSYEAIRLRCLKFGPEYARALKRRQGRLGDTWHLDEVFVTIQGQPPSLYELPDRCTARWRPTSP